MNEENELDSTCGVSDEEMTYRFQQGVKIENEIKQIKGLPIAGYDLEKNRHIWNILMDTVNMPEKIIDSYINTDATNYNKI